MPPIPFYAWLTPNPSRPMYGSAAAHPVLINSAAAHTLWCTALLWEDAPAAHCKQMGRDRLWERRPHGQGPSHSVPRWRQCAALDGMVSGGARATPVTWRWNGLEPPHVLLLELQDDNLSVLCNVGYWSKAG